MGKWKRASEVKQNHAASRDLNLQRQFRCQEKRLLSGAAAAFGTAWRTSPFSNRTLNHEAVPDGSVDKSGADCDMAALSNQLDHLS
jgi:hypothetical protein